MKEDSVRTRVACQPTRSLSGLLTLGLCVGRATTFALCPVETVCPPIVLPTTLSVPIVSPIRPITSSMAEMLPPSRLVAEPYDCCESTEAFSGCVRWPSVGSRRVWVWVWSAGSGSSGEEAYGLYAGGLRRTRWLVSAAGGVDGPCVSWLLYAVRMVVSDTLRVMDGGDVGRRVNGSITSSRFAICTAGGGDMTRTGDDVWPEAYESEWKLPVCVCVVPVV